VTAEMTRPTATARSCSSRPSRSASSASSTT